jgi:hypothetical protein
MSESRLPIHPYAELFPMMGSPEFDRLCGDIALNGLQEEIVLHEGQILEGRHRYLACLAKRVTPRFRNYAGECGSPLAFVVTKNMLRRHLTESQRALVAARLKPLFEEEARQRQRAALKQGSEVPVCENSRRRENPQENGPSAQKAAELMKVSDFSVQAACKVKNHGVPQLVDAVAAGKVSVSAAARIARLPSEQQQAALAGIERGLKPKQALAQVADTFAEDRLAWVDDDGRPLPEELIPVFQQREEFRTLCRRIEAISREVRRLGDSPAGGHLDLQGVLTALKTLRKALWTAQPARVCPHDPDEQPCCNLCRGYGWSPAGMPKNTAGLHTRSRPVKT